MLNSRTTLLAVSLLTHSLASAGTLDPAILRKELARAAKANTQASTFDALLDTWQSRYGRQGVVPLLDYAESAANPEPERYVALMGAARLGGRATAHRITPFLKSSSWLIRVGALRALRELQDPATAAATLPLLKDPALTVRTEAVATIQALRPNGAAQALVHALGAGENYQGGKALWVPGRALAALSVLKATEMAPQLLPLLDHASDPVLQLQTVATLESLTGRKLKPGQPLRERVREWKVSLLQQRAQTRAR